MNPYCSNPASLIDKRLGNSYTAVKAVYENLTDILYVAANLANLVPKDVELQESADRMFLQWRYAGSATWTNLVPLVDLPQAEFQVTSDFVLQWRYRGAATWADLTSLNNFFAQVVVAPGISKIPRADANSKLDTGWLKLDEINAAPVASAAAAQQSADTAQQDITAAQQTIATLQADLTDTQTQLTAANAALVALTARVAALEVAP
ncbi:hypothetical protein [Paraburkholderia sp. SIMBA_054]|uniref:hypothetical protein n=1 Tax=Paraburkholderia sp. SIMBA_054 TaxID=3085795 RepID=UPI0039789250